MVFVLDNYDSFTYNLVQYMGELGAEMVIRRNDELTPAEVEALHPDRILISPGPCTPQDAKTQHIGQTRTGPFHHAHAKEDVAERPVGRRCQFADGFELTVGIHLQFVGHALRQTSRIQKDYSVIRLSLDCGGPDVRIVAMD